jgi:hypothetical protein
MAATLYLLQFDTRLWRHTVSDTIKGKPMSRFEFGMAGFQALAAGGVAASFAGLLRNMGYAGAMPSA